MEFAENTNNNPSTESEELLQEEENNLVIAEAERVVRLRHRIEQAWEASVTQSISLEVEDTGLNYDPKDYEWRSAYSDMEIKEALLIGHIRIFPFTPQNLNGSSYDVTLGEYFYRTDTIHNREYYNYRNKEDIDRYFGEPLRAVTYRQWAEDHNATPWKGIDENELIIVLKPGERILAHTNEFIGIRPPGTTQMQARSSAGRNGLVVCKDAGWGDPGYMGRWTMEIQNDNEERVAIRVGERLAQLVFLGTGPVANSYGETGKYYQTKNLRDDVKNWRPQMMLPGTHNDRFNPPVAVLNLMRAT